MLSSILTRRIPREAVKRCAIRSVTTHSQLPEEHKMVYEMCRKFADEELAPNAGKWDKDHAYPTEAIAQLVSTLEDSCRRS